MMKATSAELLSQLYTCESSGECLEIARKLALYINDTGLIALQTEKIIDQLMLAAMNKKSGLEREGGLLGIAGIAEICGLKILPFLLPLLPDILDLESDKGLPVREAAHLAISNILDLVDSHGVHMVLPAISKGTSGKWMTKLAALRYFDVLGAKLPKEVCEAMPEIIPAVTNCMHDTKQEVYSFNKG